MSCLPLADLGFLSKVKFQDLVDSSKERISQIASNIQQVASKTYEVISENGTKVALAVGTSIMAMAPSSANAADVSYTESAGFTGTFNLTPFYSAVAIIVVAIGVVASIRLALTMFKKVA